MTNTYAFQNQLEEAELDADRAWRLVGHIHGAVQRFRLADDGDAYDCISEIEELLGA